MFSKLAVVSTLALLATATPTPGGGSESGGGSSAGQCNTGTPQCCSSVQKSGDPATSLILGLLGVVVQGLDIPIGLTCSPLSIIGVGSGTDCSQNPVCCDNIASGGLIGVNCVPINIDL